MSGCPGLGKCERCGKPATSVDYRPSYIDEDGDGACVGKVITCEKCGQLSNEVWLKPVKKRSGR